MMLIEVLHETTEPGIDSHDSDGIVVKYSRDIFGRELVRRITDQKTSFSHGTVAHDNASIQQVISANHYN